MQPYNKEEQSLYDQSMAFVKKKANKKAIAKKYVDQYPQEKNPVSVFMAGSPGAGKTEVSKNLIKAFGGQILRLDSDDLRHEFQGYNGTNSPLFQDAATRLLEAIHDRALDKGVSFILDSTLSNYDKAVSNIKRSLNKDRAVAIYFVYQNPEQAWAFVKAREKSEGRRVPSDVFIDNFLSSRNVVNKLKEEFQSQVSLELLIKNIDGTRKVFHSNIQSVDHYLDTKYDYAALKRITS
jgi:UDP-N-acetylglucosamine kinase